MRSKACWTNRRFHRQESTAWRRTMTLSNRFLSVLDADPFLRRFLRSTRSGRCKAFHENGFKFLSKASQDARLPPVGSVEAARGPSGSFHRPTSEPPRRAAFCDVRKPEFPTILFEEFFLPSHEPIFVNEQTGHEGSVGLHGVTDADVILRKFRRRIKCDEYLCAAFRS